MSEYGAAGLVGLLPPQANTTVEAELGVLLEPGTASIVSRLTCYADDSRERLLGYFAAVGAALRAFDTSQPDVALFACTGSTYLVGLAEEDRRFSGFGFPVISAARAVLEALHELDAKRIALVTPYPDWLTEACAAFWRAQGREITAIRRVQGVESDTRAIYGLTSRDALAALTGLEADAVLVTGTGMPSLRALARSPLRVPVLSSNLCLAWAAARRLYASPLAAWISENAAWRARLEQRYPQ